MASAAVASVEVLTCVVGGCWDLFRGVSFGVRWFSSYSGGGIRATAAVRLGEVSISVHYNIGIRVYLFGRVSRGVTASPALGFFVPHDGGSTSYWVLGEYWAIVIAAVLLQHHSPPLTGRASITGTLWWLRFKGPPLTC